MFGLQTAKKCNFLYSTTRANVNEPNGIQNGGGKNTSISTQVYDIALSPDVLSIYTPHDLYTHTNWLTASTRGELQYCIYYQVAAVSFHTAPKGEILYMTY